MVEDWDQYEGNRVRAAKRESAMALARYAGMKLRARMNPRKAATGSFPYPARTCRQWGPVSVFWERKAEEHLR